MERKQGSSTDLLIDPRKNDQGYHEHPQRTNINIVKMDNKDDDNGAIPDFEGGAGSQTTGGSRSFPKDPATISKIKDKFRGCLLGGLIGDCIGT